MDSIAQRRLRSALPRNSVGAFPPTPTLIVEPGGDPPEPAIRVVQNWYGEFREREQD